MSQGIQNPLPKGVAVQVRPRAPYLNAKASALVGALLYLAQSDLFPKQVKLLFLTLYPENTPQ